MSRQREKNRIIISDDIIYLILETKQGIERARTIIDKEDYPKVLAFGRKFHLKINTFNKRKYALYARNNSVMLHQIIMGIGKQIDHINGNGLDNRKCNLRFCNHAQNNWNSKKNITNTSGFKGVCWSKEKKKWIASIRVNGYQYYLGYFDNLIKAAKTYNRAAKKYHGEFAKLNRIPMKKPK